MGSLTSRYPQTGMCLDGFEASSSPRYGLTDPISANLEGAVMFEAPELPEETLMEVNMCCLELLMSKTQQTDSVIEK